MSSNTSFQAVIEQTFVQSSNKSPILSKWARFGDIDVIRKQRSTVFTIKLMNYGQTPVIISSYTKQQAINAFYSSQWTIMGKPGEQDRNWGFNYTYKRVINNSYPLVLKPGTPTNPTVVDFAEVFYDGNGLSETELHPDYGVIFTFNTDDPTEVELVETTQLQKNQIVLEGHPIGFRWEPKAKITHTKNVHGYLSTPKISSLEKWREYAERRISETLVGYATTAGVPSWATMERLKIADFLEQSPFLNNKKFDDDFPEMKRVLNRFKDPLPPYDFIWPHGDRYAYNGLRRTYDYIPNSRIEDFYRVIQSILLDNTRRDQLEKYNFLEKRQIPGVDPSILKEIKSDGTYIVRQRREWGFREKVLKGFPYFIPKSIQSQNKNTNTVFGGCGTGPVIAGFVTAGSGIFSGISPSVEIKYDFLESQRTIRSATDTAYGTPRVPTGLIFIQDESGAIGFSIGTDMRYMDSPLYHDTAFTEPSTDNDKMHLGSHGLPKPDFRQFLREGDLVIIQVGVGFKYWHPVLGTEPRHWESLYSFNEAQNQTVFTKISYNITTEVVDNPDIDNLECSCVPGVSDKNCIPVLTYMGEQNLKGKYPPYPCDGMEFGEKKVITFVSSDGKKRKSFLFTKYSNGECECRKFYPGSEPEITCHKYWIFSEPTIIGNNQTPGQGAQFLGTEIQKPWYPGSLIFNPFDGENYVCDLKKVTSIVLNPEDYDLNNILEEVKNLSVGSIIKITGSELELFEFELVSVEIIDGYIRLNVKFRTSSGDGTNCGPYIICFTQQTGDIDDVDEQSKSELHETIADFVWTSLGSPPNKLFNNIKPYIDNWGGYTNPKINRSKETAIDVPPYGNILIPPFPLYIGHKDQPLIFDAGFPEDESVDQSIRVILDNTLTYGGKITEVITGIISNIVSGKTLEPASIILGIMLTFGAQALTQQIYIRNRYILPSRTRRDSPSPYTDFYPIQEDHPWSTGTPVPVNSGMEYVMADVFSIDTRERFAPPPLEISASELRGIPEETHKFNPDDEWKIPKKYQDKLDEQSVLITKENQYDEFLTIKAPQTVPGSGMIGEPSTPYTANPGSIYKGNLIKIKNVRFVEPPLRKYYVPKAAKVENVDKFKKEYEDTLTKLQQELEKNILFKIEDFEIDLSNSPFSNTVISYEKISDSTLEFIEILNSLITVIQSILNVFGQSIDESLRKTDPNSVGPPTKAINYTSYINDFLITVKQVTDKLELASRIMLKIQKENKISGFKNQAEITRFLCLKNNIDLTGFTMKVNHVQELVSIVFKTVGGIDVLKLITDFTMSVLLRLMGGSIEKVLRQVHTAWNNLYLQEEHEVNEYFKGPIGPSLEFEEITFFSDFPWTVDKKDGGYWWTCPDIPLTNARSHQNDQNWGNPDNTTDNDDGLFFLGRNQDGGFSFIENPDPNARRHVFSQLVSSNKPNLSVPIFDPFNIENLFNVVAGDDHLVTRYGGNKHEYSIDYIKSRYIKDLGASFSSSYMPFAEEWKPYKWEKDANGNPIKNEFKPITPGTRFFGDRIYYIKDEKNVVVPIRINANTEIARETPLVPTGLVDVVGIAWQYSGGKPGLEWERERYMMQVWPRYFSDVGIKWTPPVLPKLPEIDGGGKDPDVPVVTPPDEPKGPRKLPDLTLDIGDAGNPARLDCESVRGILDGQNQFKEQLKKQSDWPVDREYDRDPKMNVHKDPVTGREILMPKNIKEVIDAMPDYPCKGMKIGEQQTVTITSQQFPGVVRKFFFMVGPNGECLCTMYQPGSEGGGSVDRTDGSFGGGFPPTDNGGDISRRTGERGILG